MDWSGLIDFLQRGGPALWLIACLSVLTLALILWKTWRLIRSGAWSGAHTDAALSDWCGGRRDKAMTVLAPRRSLRARWVAVHRLHGCRRYRKAGAQCRSHEPARRRGCCGNQR